MAKAKNGKVINAGFIQKATGYMIMFSDYGLDEEWFEREAKIFVSGKWEAEFDGYFHPKLQQLWDNIGGLKFPGFDRDGRELTAIESIKFAWV